MRFEKGESLIKTLERTVSKAFGAVVRSIIKHICPFLWARTSIVVATKGQSKDSI